MYNWNAYTHTYTLMLSLNKLCEKYYFKIFYPYDMSDYLAMHFAVVQNKINCLAAAEIATA